MERLIDFIDDNTGLVLAAVVFIATATLVFAVLAAVRLHGAVRKRAAVIGREPTAPSDKRGIAARHRHESGASGSSTRTTKHYSSLDESNMRVLRSRLVQAGIFDPRAVGLLLSCPRRAGDRRRRPVRRRRAPLLPEWRSIDVLAAGRRRRLARLSGAESRA